MNSPSEQPTQITKLPDGSGCFTATVMSREEAMALPVNERPLCFRISSEIYHAVFEAIGAASMCWNPSPSDEVFNSTEAEKVAVDLCFKIAKDQERELSRLRAELALRDAREEELKQSLEVLTNSEQMWMEQCSDAQTRLVSMEAVVEGIKKRYDEELTSLRSQLAEAQSNYQTLLDAVNHEIELRKAAEDQLAKVESELTATRARLAESEAAHAELTERYKRTHDLWIASEKEKGNLENEYESLKSRLAELEGIADRLYQAAKSGHVTSAVALDLVDGLIAYEAYKEGKK